MSETTMKNVAIVVLILMVIWLSLQVIRLERYHYASFLGICTQADPKDPVSSVKRDQCLNSTETRTNALWHLYYGAINRY
jgi:hypothetical protein